MRTLGDWRPTIPLTEQFALDVIETQSGLAATAILYQRLDPDVNWKQVAITVNDAVAIAIDYAGVSPEKAVAAVGKGVQNYTPATGWPFMAT